MRLAACLLAGWVMLAPARGSAAEEPAPKAPAAAEKPKARPLPVDAQVLFLEATQLKLQDKYADAIEKFKKVLEADKDSADVLFEIGFCYYRLGKNKEALEHLKRAVELAPQNGPAHETLAFVYNALRDMGKSLDELEAAAKSADRPRNHEGLVQRIALIYERQGDYKNAIQWYCYLLECGYRGRKAYLSLGAMQLKEKLYDDALASFREVVRRSETEEGSVADVASAFGQLSEADRNAAIARYEGAAAKSDDPALLEAVALAYQAAGRDDEMLKTLERAAGFASERTGAQKEFLAEHFEDIGELPKAIEWRVKIAESRKNGAAEDYVRIAALYVKHEEMAKAADYFAKAIAADPQRRDLTRRIADCWSELYQWDKAAATLEAYLQNRDLGPTDAEALFELGEVYAQAGKPTLAAERKKRAFDLLARAVGKTGSKDAEVQLQLTLAQLCSADEQNDKALGYVVVAQQLDPDDSRKLLLLAAAYKRVQNWAEAAATLLKYAEKAPSPLAAAGLAIEVAACQEAAGQADAAAATREKAKALLLKIADSAQNDTPKAAIHIELGEMALARNQPKAAIELFLEALRLDPKQALAHLHLGQCYQSLGDWARAAAHYKSHLDSIQVGEGQARIVYRLGVAQTRSGQPDLGRENKLRAIQMLLDALATLEKEQRGTPTHKAEIYRDLAGLYSGEKDHAKAIQAIDAAIRLAPSGKRADYQLTLASLHDELKRYDQSEKVLLEAQKAEPANPAVLNHLGYFYAERGRNLDQAVDLVKKALHYDPLNGAYLDSLGWAYYQQGKHEEALQLLLRAAQSEEDAVIRDHLGDAYHKLGKTREAREAWTKALALDPDIQGVADKLKKTQPKDDAPKAPEKGGQP